MNKYKIFVSGVQKELETERRAVKKFILYDALFSEYFEVFLFEDEPAKGISAEKVYFDEVGKSDIYIGILGNQYGGSDRDKISATEAEFREAREKHKYILIYIKGQSSADKNREAGLQKLIKEIKDSKDGYSYKRFNNEIELTQQLVYASLIDFLKKNGIVGRSAFDEQVCTKADMKDIDEDKVRWFLGVARSERKLPLNLNTPVKDVLTHLRLLHEGKLTNAAILLFGKDPHKYFLQAEVKCAQFFGTEIKKPFTSYKVYSGNLFEQIEKSVAFVCDILGQAVIQQEYTPQFSRPFEIPVFAIQEAIVNAVAHRNYNVTSGVQVMVFSDRVEVWNSGSLPHELKVEDLKKSHTSFPANPRLANVLYFANYTQRIGSGTLEMIEQCRAQGAPEPEFTLIRNLEFRTFLPRDIFTEAFLNRFGLNERQMKAIKFIKENRNISRKQYVALAGISPRMAHLDMIDMVKKKLIVSKDKGRATTYVLHN